jgi:hypothetical protein
VRDEVTVGRPVRRTLTVPEAAKVTGVSVETIRGLIHGGRLKLRLAGANPNPKRPTFLVYADEVLTALDRAAMPAVDPRAAVGTTEALIESWLADRKAAGKRSAAHEAARMREYVIPRLGHVPADELRPTQIRTLVRELQQTKSPKAACSPAGRSCTSTGPCARCLPRPWPTSSSTGTRWC